MNASGTLFQFADVKTSGVRLTCVPGGHVICQKPQLVANGNGTWTISYKFAIDGDSTNTKAGSSPTNDQ